ncbi:MAG: T9SS type B sorting domain-containing protein [Robiginitalea sp.]
MRHRYLKTFLLACTAFLSITAFSRMVSYSGVDWALLWNTPLNPVAELVPGDSDKESRGLFANEDVSRPSSILSNTAQDFDSFFNCDTQPNPIIGLVNNTSNTIDGEVVVCPNDGDPLPKIFLCGFNDVEPLQVSIPGAVSIQWERLDEGSCGPVLEDCANKNSSCSWSSVGSGNSYQIGEAGEFRLVVNFDDGCLKRYYFKVFKNPLEPQYNATDIICGAPGNITVTNIPLDYEFQLLDAATGSILVPFSAGNGPSFDVLTPGSYSVELRQQGVPNGCLFFLDNIQIQNQNLAASVATSEAGCSGLGNISVSVSEGEPQIYYTLLQGGLTVDTFGPTTNPDYTFENITPGNYDVRVDLENGCSTTYAATIDDTSDLELFARVSQNVTCKEGNILMSSDGGQTPHRYAIWEFIDESGITQTSYPTPEDIPTNAFQTSVIFDILEPGFYRFVVIDRNGCFDISNQVRIYFVPPVEFAPTTVIDETCFGDSSGTIQFNILNRNGYQTMFTLIDETGAEIASNSSGFFMGLPQGDYTVRLNLRKGSASCEYFEYYTISGPPNALAGDAVLVQDYTCLQEGIIEVQNVTGGNPPYEYSIDGVNFGSGAGSETFSGLSPGTYTITIRDASGCVLQTNPVIIDPVNPPEDIVFSTPPLDCSSPTTDITAVIAGGTEPLTVEIIAPSSVPASSLAGNTAQFNGLAPGTYTFQVTDAEGCAYTESYTIPAITPIQIIGNVAGVVSCLGDANGSASFIVSGFSGTYSYTVDGGVPVTGQTSGTISLNNLSGGTYAVEVVDETTGCTDAVSVNIEAPATPLSLTFSTEPPSCVSSGSVTISPSGGWGSYEYELLQPDGSVLASQSSNSFTGLTQSGSYTITVRDGGGCEITGAFSFADVIPPALTVDPASVVCYQLGSPASITLAVADGTAPFSYNINGGPFQSAATFDGLAPGTYGFSVIDANGCTDDITVTIAEELGASAALVKDFDCTAAPDAVIDLTLTGGSAPYAYEVSYNGGGYAPYTGGFPFTATAAGTYQFRITDTLGCSTETNVITTTPAVNPQATATVTDPNCFGEANGVVEIAVDPNFGVPPYEINFNAGGYSNQTVYPGLAAGSYSYTVRDSNECLFTDTAVLADPALFDAVVTVNDVTCDPLNGGDQPGSIDVAISSGGVPDFTYTLYDSRNTLVATVTTASTSHSFGGLTFGDYYLRVVDASGCEFYQNPVRVLQNPYLTLLGVPSIDNCIDGGTAEISASGGSGDYTFSIYGPGTGPDNLTPGSTADEEIATFEGLNGGQSYIFEAIDNQTFCRSYIQVDIPAASSIVILDPAITDVTCAGSADGTISFQVEGFDAGVTQINYQILESLTNTPLGPPYEGTVSVPSGGPGPSPVVTVNGLAPGLYVLFVEEGSSPSCSTTYPFQISEPTPIVLSLISQNNANCLENANVTVRATGGSGFYEYAFVQDGVSPSPADFAASSYAELDPALSANWDVYAMDDTGCVAGPLDVAITADPEPLISAALTNQCVASEGQYEIVTTLGAAGVGPYWISIDGGAFQASGFTAAGDTFVFSNLLSGSHTITVRDSNGCTHQVIVSVDPPLGISALATAQPSCTVADGEITITAQGGSGNYAYDLLIGGTISVTGGSPQASNIFTGLADGAYTAVVYDTGSGGCVLQSTIPVVLEQATPVTFDPHTLVDVSCFGATDGAVRINLSPTAPGVNDNPPYTYNLYDAGGLLLAGPQADPWFTGLAAGTYEVEAVSGRNCSLREAVQITAPPAIVLDATATEFSCSANNVVSVSVITATATGGTAPYLYSIDGSNYISSNTFSLTDTGSAQNITVYARDANGCVETALLNIEPLNTFDAVVTVVSPISCINPEEILITVNDNGDTSNVYTFELLPAGNPNGTATGNPAYNQASFDLSIPDNYTFRVTDTATGCFVDVTHQVAPYDLAEVLAAPLSPTVCFGDSSGELTIEVTGYTGAYDYEVFVSDGTPTGIAGSGDTANNPLTITGLSGGNHFVRITQTAAPFCQEDSNVVTIVSPNAPLASVLQQVADVTCTNDQGEILVTPAGGYAPYDLLLTNTTTGQSYTATGVVSRVFTGLSAGDYTLSVADAEGCVYNDAVTLTEPLPITGEIRAVPTALSCFGGDTAIVEAFNVSGGEGGYLYVLNYYDESGSAIEFSSGFQPSPIFENLGAGIYSISITDAWNCDFETPQVVITEPDEVSASLVQNTAMTCSTDAELVLTASGGTAPYEYSPDGVTFFPMSGGNTHVFTVTDGSYQYFVRDSLGCEASVSNQVNIEPLAPLVLNLNTSGAILNCSGESTASISATASGALGGYQFELYGDAGLTNLLSGPQANGSFYNLGPGSYWVRVTSADCEEVSSEVVITEPAPLQVDREEFTDITCSGQDDGTITVEVSGGTGEILYAISPNLDKFDTVNEFTGLAPGTYAVIAQDQSGCFLYFQFFLGEPNPIDATATATTEVCTGSADGTIDVQISGGTAPYRTSLNSPDEADFVQDQTSFTNLSAGTYVIFVRDAQDCETSVIVEVEPGVNLNAEVTPIYECTDILPENYLEVILEDPTIADEVMYALDSTDPADMQLDADFRSLPPGPHYLAISHSNGCLITLDFEIAAFEPLALTLEMRNINEITAIAAGGQPEYTFFFNGEDNGSDNTYYINQTGTYTVRVVDQNGCIAEAEIFMEFIDIEIPNFFTPNGDGLGDSWIPENLQGFPEILIKIYDRYGRVVAEVTQANAWDGTYDGKELPTGDYWYVIKLNGENDAREFVGHFTLYR